MANTPISPKVKAGGNWAAYATLALTLLSVVTPDSLSFMGHLAPLGYGLVVGGSYATGAWLKSDDIRDVGAAKIAADAVAAAAKATSAELPPVATVNNTFAPAAAPVTLPAVVATVDSGFQSKIEAALSGSTAPEAPAAEAAPVAPEAAAAPAPAPAEVPAAPAGVAV